MGDVYYERYPGDYARDTRRLSLAEHGAYTLLLDDYYSPDGGPLPAALEALYRVCGCQDDAERDAVKSVATKFFPVRKEDGLRHNKRADKQLAGRAEFLSEQSARGKASWEARKSRGQSVAIPSKRTTVRTTVQTGLEPRHEPNNEPEHEPGNEPLVTNPPSPSPSPSVTPSPPPSVKPPPARGGIAWSGTVLVVDGEAHAQFRRLYDEQWLLEQYPQIDVKLAVLSTATDPWEAHRALGYCTTWLTRAKSATKTAPAAPPPDTRPKCARCHADPATETGGLCRVCAKSARRAKPALQEAGDVAREILESLRIADGTETEDEIEEVA